VFVEEPVSITGGMMMTVIGVTYSADLNVNGDIIGSGQFVRLEDGVVVECGKSESSFSVLDGGHD
jgi:hypothetical protein